MNKKTNTPLVPPYSISKREEEPQNFKLSDRTAGKCEKVSGAKHNPTSKQSSLWDDGKQSLTKRLASKAEKMRPEDRATGQTHSSQS